jgi:hypothetical protein
MVNFFDSIYRYALVIVLCVSFSSCISLVNEPKYYNSKAIATLTDKISDAYGGAPHSYAEFVFPYEGKKYTTKTDFENVYKGTRYNIYFDSLNPYINYVLFDEPIIEAWEKETRVCRIIKLSKEHEENQVVYKYVFEFYNKNKRITSDRLNTTERWVAKDTLPINDSLLKVGQKFEVIYSVIDPRLCVINFNKPIKEIYSETKGRIYKVSKDNFYYEYFIIDGHLRHYKVRKEYTSGLKAKYPNIKAGDIYKVRYSPVFFREEKGEIELSEPVFNEDGLINTGDTSVVEITSENKQENKIIGQFKIANKKHTIKESYRDNIEIDECYKVQYDVFNPNHAKILFDYPSFKKEEQVITVEGKIVVVSDSTVQYNYTTMKGEEYNNIQYCFLKGASKPTVGAVYMLEYSIKNPKYSIIYLDKPMLKN